MNLGIIGSRNFNNYRLLYKTILSLLKLNDIKNIISGGAKGADSLGEKFADDNKINKIIFYPEWNKYGKKAGYLRNINIVENSDYIIAFWNGKSKGTEHSINLAKKYNKKIKIVIF